MEPTKPGIPPRYYSLSDAAEVMKIKPEILLRALAQLPTLKRRYGTWTIDDLSQLDAVAKEIIARKGEL